MRDLETMSDLEKLTAERDALAAQAGELLRVLIQLNEQAERALDFDIGNYRALKGASCAADNAIATTPQQHLAEAIANTAEKFYYMGWEHSLSTKSDDGDHYACGKRLAKSFADSIRKGGAV